MSSVRAAASNDEDCATIRAMCSRSSAAEEIGAPTRAADRLVLPDRTMRPDRRPRSSGVRHVARRQNHRALDRIAQLAEIAAPRV